MYKKDPKSLLIHINKYYMMFANGLKEQGVMDKVTNMRNSDYFEISLFINFCEYNDIDYDKVFANLHNTIRQNIIEYVKYFYGDKIFHHFEKQNEKLSNRFSIRDGAKFSKLTDL